MPKLTQMNHSVTYCSFNPIIPLSSLRRACFQPILHFPFVVGFSHLFFDHLMCHLTCTENIFMDVFKGKKGLKKRSSFHFMARGRTRILKWQLSVTNGSFRHLGWLAKEAFKSKRMVQTSHGLIHVPVFLSVSSFPSVSHTVLVVSCR